MTNNIKTNDKANTRVQSLLLPFTSYLPKINTKQKQKHNARHTIFLMLRGNLWRKIKIVYKSQI